MLAYFSKVENLGGGRGFESSYRGWGIAHVEHLPSLCKALGWIQKKRKDYWQSGSSGRAPVWQV
jgi:hypothetical protein